MSDIQNSICFTGGDGQDGYPGGDGGEGGNGGRITLRIRPEDMDLLMFLSGNPSVKGGEGGEGTPKKKSLSEPIPI